MYDMSGREQGVWTAADVRRTHEDNDTYEYKVIPFLAASRPGTSEVARAGAAAQQFERLLAQGDVDGWQYYRMDHFSLKESPGCLGALFGGGMIYRRYDMAIFRRRK